MKLVIFFILSICFNFKSHAQVSAYFLILNPQGVVGEPIDFEDYSTGNITSWTWYFGDGDSSTLQHPTHTYLQPGLYDVSLKVSDGIYTNTYTKLNAISVFGTTAELKHIKNVALFTIHPNPANNNITIDYQSQNENEKIEFYDLMGKLIHEEPFVGSKINIDFLQSGVYLVAIQSKLGILAQTKLVKY